MNTQELSDQHPREAARDGDGRSDESANRKKAMFKLAALVAVVIAGACVAGKVAAAYGFLHAM